MFGVSWRIQMCGKTCISKRWRPPAGALRPGSTSLDYYAGNVAFLTSAEALNHAAHKAAECVRAILGDREPAP